MRVVVGCSAVPLYIYIYISLISPKSYAVLEEALQDLTQFCQLCLSGHLHASCSRWGVASRLRFRAWQCESGQRVKGLDLLDQQYVTTDEEWESALWWCYCINMPRM